MAARFWVNGGVDNNWSTIGNWSLTSGGAGGQTVPSALDDVTLDGAGNSACILNTATAKVAKTLTINGYTGSLTFNVNLSVSGSITFTTTGFSFAGTGLLRMIAAGTWTTNGKAVGVGCEIGGTTTFTCTLADALAISGVAATGAALLLSNTTSTIFSGAFNITVTVDADISVSGSQTITLTGNVTCPGATNILDANVINGTFNWTTRTLALTGALTGTTTIVFDGASQGIWSGGAAISNPININIVSGGSLAITGTVLRLGANTLTWTAGTVTDGGSAILSIGASTTLDMNGKTLPSNIIITAAITLTLNSLLVIGNSYSLTLPNAAVTFAGSTGFTIGTFTNTTITATRIWTFTFGNTYTITANFDLVSAAAQTVRFTLKSSSAGNKVVFILAGGATQDVGFADPTDLDSSGGQTIFSYHGVITTTFNWSNTLPVNVLPARPLVVSAPGSR